MTQYLIVSDIDGTLTANHHDVTEKTTQAIANAVTAGAAFYVATGRMHALAEVVAHQFQPMPTLLRQMVRFMTFPVSGSITHWGRRR